MDESRYNLSEEKTELTEKMTFDEALERVGASNKYQKIVFVYFGF